MDKPLEDIYKLSGAKGGSTPTTKLKGWAYMRAHDPARFKSLTTKGGKASKRSKNKGVDTE